MFSGSCSDLLPGEGAQYRLQRPAWVRRPSARVRLSSRLRCPHSSPSGAPLPSTPLPSTRLPSTRPTHRLPRKYSGTTRTSSKIQELIKPQRNNDLKGWEELWRIMTFWQGIMNRCECIYVFLYDLTIKWRLFTLQLVFNHIRAECPLSLVSWWPYLRNSRS